jgi:hypothetical protein
VAAFLVSVVSVLHCWQYVLIPWFSMNTGVWSFDPHLVHTSFRYSFLKNLCLALRSLLALPILFFLGSLIF